MVVVVVGLWEEVVGANVGRGVKRLRVREREERKDGAVGRRGRMVVMRETGVGVGSIKAGV